MPPIQRKKSALRIIIPFALAVGAIALAIAVGLNTTKGRNANQPSTPLAQGGSEQAELAQQTGPAVEPLKEPTTGAPAPQPEPESEQDDPSPSARPAAQPPAAEAPTNPALVGLKARTFEAPASSPASLGSLDPGGAIKLRAEFSIRDAGVTSLRLADGFTTADAEHAAAAGDPVTPEDHVEVQSVLRHGDLYLTPLAASSITLDNQTVYLDFAPIGSTVWKETAPGTFEARIANDQDQDVARVVRTYTLDPDSHNLYLSQRVENLTPAPFTAQLVTIGPTDQPKDSLGYGGDKRRVRFGYLASPAIDPARNVVSADDYLLPRQKTFGPIDKATGNYEPVDTVWPNASSTEKQRELVWLGVTTRYYAAILHKDLPDTVDLSNPKAPAINRVFDDVVRVERVLINKPEPKAGMFGGTKQVNDPLMALSVTAAPMTVPANGANSQNWGLYVGPLSPRAIKAEPESAALGLDEIVVYNFGGPCSFCTFTWLTGPLRNLLTFLHSITFDWALSIILLVVCVRTLLHPITRWSQIKMQRFGKQMQGMAPKQKKIQERYKDDPAKMREEMGKLWREEGVSPAGFLGCLPMFLQSPVWIALYATLYFTYDLRHEPAFFGIFQNLTNNAWHFMGDLSEPDRAITFGGGFALPLMGTIKSLNILPLALGAVFYVHQKYLTPPTGAAMTPEQESQQKMMRIISVFMFPILMYNAPCGLSLYFITNSTLAILETRWIRAHMDKHNMLDPEHLKRNTKAAPKPGSWRHRLAVKLEEQQRLRAEQDHRSPKREPRAGKAEAPERRYKKKK